MIINFIFYGINKVTITPDMGVNTFYIILHDTERFNLLNKYYEIRII